MEASLFQAGVRRLLFAFVGFLALFLAFRWQPEPWLGRIIAQQAAQAGWQAQWRDLAIDGWRLVAEGVRLSRNGRAIALDRIELAPAWRKLFAAEPALWVGLHALGGTLSGVAALSEHRIAIEDASLRLPAERLAPWIARQASIAATPEGMIEGGGTVILDVRDGRPLQGEIDAVWRDAAVTVEGFGKSELGEYALHLESKGAADPWRWQIEGGTALRLEARGDLRADGADPWRWSVSGSGRVEAGPGMPPILARMLGHGAQLHIAGPFSRPVLRFQ
ncbi:MAG: hypothetical protein R8K47_07635 [Mariprofundaceae bacterium]